MRPISNQPACFFATAKTYKFDIIQGINIKDLKLYKPITHQPGTYISYIHGSCGVFKTFAKNEFTIIDTLAFPKLLKINESSDDYKDV